MSMATMRLDVQYAIKHVPTGWYLNKGGRFSQYGTLALYHSVHDATRAIVERNLGNAVIHEIALADKGPVSPHVGEGI